MEEWRLDASVAMLWIAAVSDLRNRSVSDWLWISFGVDAAALNAVDLPANLLLTAISIAVTGTVSFAVYGLGLFGAADAFALFVLARLMPPYSGSFSAGSASPLFPLAVLVNALALSTCQIIFNVARNLVSWLQKREELFSVFEGETMARKAAPSWSGSSQQTPNSRFR